MSSIPLSSIPETLRPITHFVKIANEYSTRDVIIYYWCIYKAIEEAMKLDKQSTDALNIITSLLSTLEELKKQHPDMEALRAEIVAQAHIEDQAKKLLTYAEQQDAQAEFNQKVIKAFYTAGYLFDVLTVFGPLDENIQSARKYAKWRAIYISQCLKKGEQPIPGMQQNEGKTDESKKNEDDDELARFAASMGLPSVPYTSATSNTQFGFTQNFQQPPFEQPDKPVFGTEPGANIWPTNIQQHGIQQPFRPLPHSAPLKPEPEPQQQFVPQDLQNRLSSISNVPSTLDSSFAPAQNLSLEDYIEAKKYTKYASSALDYEDPKTAIDNMLKAISILQKRNVT